MLQPEIPLKPPREWFDQPEPNGPQPLRYEADGRVSGHLALWDQCHTGFLPECVRPQRGDDFALFHTGLLELDDGDQLPVGKVVYDGPHASTSIGTTVADASRHYDDNAHVGAYVRAKEGRFGIWLSGALRSDLSPEGLRNMRANPPSGDWRGVRDRLKMIAALAVPIPGYPIPQVAVTAAGDVPTALIMAGYTEEEPMATRDRSYIRKRKMISKSLTAAASTFTAEQRRELAKSGEAMPDGSFPIRNCQDWQDAKRSIGRTPPGKRARVIAHINKRGKALGCSN
jgi:hypothetical protein